MGIDSIRRIVNLAVLALLSSMTVFAETLVFTGPDIAVIQREGIPLQANETYSIWCWAQNSSPVMLELNGQKFTGKPTNNKTSYAWRNVGSYKTDKTHTVPFRLYDDADRLSLGEKTVGFLALTTTKDWNPDEWFALSRVFNSTLSTPKDQRLTVMREVDDFYTFPTFTSKDEWLARKSELKDRLLASMGCLPEPPRFPLNAHVFDKQDYGDFTIEKVYFESVPGLYVTGNVYRPKGISGKHPAVLCPHGHWKQGRLTHLEENSIPTRCANFAKRGIIAFAIDMIGYNDSLQFEHRFGNEAEWFWGFSAHGIQFWNNVRAIDFLQSLDDVDQNRIGCTGASGGGTQTYTLMAVDERISVAAPVNMLSAHYQGGCVCENAPNLRIDAFNLEFGAMMAPRPLKMIACTGDWTKETPRVEYPAMQSIYQLFNTPDKVSYTQIDADHNYNRLSSEAVYAWFERWWYNKESETSSEIPVEFKEFESFRVFPDGLPAGAKQKDDLFLSWKEIIRRQLQDFEPTSTISLIAMKEELGRALSSVLSVHVPSTKDLLITRVDAIQQPNYAVEKILLGRKAAGDQIPALVYTPVNYAASRHGVVLVSEHGKQSFFDPQTGKPGALLASLLNEGKSVLLPDLFLTGEYHSPFQTTVRDMNTTHFHTYNQSTTALRVQDIVTAMVYAQSRYEIDRVSLITQGDAGLWGLLAATQVDFLASAVIDSHGLNLENDEAMLHRFYIPHLQRVGDFETAQALLAPMPLLIHNTQNTFATEWAQSAYRSSHAEDKLTISAPPITHKQAQDWMNAF